MKKILKFLGIGPYQGAFLILISAVTFLVINRGTGPRADSVGKYILNFIPLNITSIAVMMSGGVFLFFYVIFRLRNS